MNSASGRNMVGFIHTTPVTITMTEKFMKRYLPRTEFVHMYNGNVKVDNFRSPVGITPKINMLRYVNFAAELEKAGCGVLVSCCSLMPRAVKYASEVVEIPFIQLDAVILDHAVERYSRIGVINTTEYVVPYLEEGLRERAAKLNKKIEIFFSNDITALALFNEGKFEEYETIVLSDISKLSDENIDCVLMGQIPFALMEDKIHAAQFKIPILYAGEVAFKRIGELLNQQL